MNWIWYTWIFSHPSGGNGTYVIIFDVDISSSTKIDNKKKDILILWKGPTQGLGEHSLSAEKTFTKSGITFSLTFTNVNSLSFVSMNNQERKVRPETVNVNSDEPEFFPYSVKTSKCSGSCNNINDPYPKICVPDVVKNINLKVFNLSRNNETWHLEWLETCKCKCRLDGSAYNNNQAGWKINVDVNVMN